MAPSTNSAAISRRIHRWRVSAQCRRERLAVLAIRSPNRNSRPKKRSDTAPAVEGCPECHRNGGEPGQTWLVTSSTGIPHSPAGGPRRSTWIGVALLALGATLLLVFALRELVGSDDSDDESAGSSTTAAGVAPAEPGATPVRAIPQVLETRAHDPEAFTQGFEFVDGRLFESTGLVGQSTLRELDPETGDVVRSVDVGSDYFAEGLTAVDDALIQLTWQDGVALVYDRETFQVRETFSYEGEGWGLCQLDANRLVMSDGSDVLTFRDPQSFEVIGTVAVTRGTDSITRLNELECVDGTVWANVWKTDLIMAIDPTTGAVTSTVDATGLLPADQAAGADVLNGIAYDDDAGTFWLTGKLWPSMFEVTFVEG
ncbi:MAG: glutaminyl-peptide cyclotransferase [Acidimicrobiales bacterium]|nr:glutaminyl-peptide cyclotransferase [Acidimicrobiales bacterium]